MLNCDQLTYQKRLKKCSFSLSEGHLLALIGPNGAGKSTLLEVLAGWLPPTEGNAYFYDETLFTFSRTVWTQKVAYLPASFHFPFPYLVGEFVGMGRFPHGFDFKYWEKDKEVSNALLETGLFDLRFRKITELSSGEKQRTRLARTLAQKGKLLLLDEPTNFFDLKQKIQFWSLLKKFKEQKKSLLIATHDLYFVEKYADAVLALNKGATTFFGSKEGFFKSGEFDSLFNPC